jgi:hypothetical protein
MGLITGLLTLPVAPVRGVVWIAEQIQRAVEQEAGEEGTRQRLAELQLARDAGQISADEYAAAEAALVDHLLRISQERERGTHG